ncbi:response regulator [Larkinella bovis]|uniref:histidine kinase n=1 Tax=Larkinella bovis TaxID=683041 RepID=A0ABW0I755_9BACT
MAPKILYIEDEIHIRDNIADILRAYGYEVATVANGQEGIRQAMITPPDLILCDIRMPEMDGYQVLEAIRSNRSLTMIPFIFLTARTEELDIRRGMVAGADDYLKKPFAIESLLQTIKSRLQREAQRKTDLQNRLEEIRQTATTVTNHEYNTPLNGILGFATLLIDHYDEYKPEDRLAMLRLIKTSGLRLKRSLDNLRLIDTLRNLEPGHSVRSFYTSGTARLDAPFVKQCLDQINERYDQEGRVQLALASDQLALSTGSLGIILEELIDNAYKFSDGSRPIEITGCREGTKYKLTFLNQGQPFKHDDIARINPFIQFDRQQYEQQGFGLGLAIVKKLLDLNQGTLAIESRPHGLTEVTVLFHRLIDQEAS